MITYRKGSLEYLKKILFEINCYHPRVKIYEKGDLILSEGGQNSTLRLILSGTVELQKEDALGKKIVISQVGPGNFIGILSSFLGKSVYITAMAVKRSELLELSSDELKELKDKDGRIHEIIESLLTKNLADRFTKMVDLRLELDRAQSELIHKEKLATLGQLLPGIAHEINNPISSLSRSVEHITDFLKHFIKQTDRDLISSYFLQLGIETTTPDTITARNRMKEICLKFPGVDRSFARKLSLLPDEDLEKHIFPNIHSKAVSKWVDIFEAGNLIRSLNVSHQRVDKIIQTLKNYSRPSTFQFRSRDLREGVLDTILIFKPRMKDIELQVDLPDIPNVLATSELNQVWTNLLRNSLDAMKEKGKIKISCKVGSNGKYVIFMFEDSGPGIPQALKEMIFNTYFTTKDSTHNLGMGLGLAISSELIQKHGGMLLTQDSSNLGGACFVVKLPVDQS